jgi:3-hydroxybutyryl-CoA dehydrogenase
MTLTADKETTLVDRFTFAAIAEAGRLVDEGIASAKDIDLAMRAGAGFAVGPLEMADTLGLDAVLEKLSRLQARYGDNYAPGATLRKLVSAGSLGKKTGRGYLEYR